MARRPIDPRLRKLVADFYTACLHRVRDGRVGSKDEERKAFIAVAGPLADQYGEAAFIETVKAWLADCVEVERLKVRTIWPPLMRRREAKRKARKPPARRALRRKRP